MPRRERATIVGELLETLARAGQSGERRLTQAAARANLPYDRFRDYVADLQARGLVEAADPFVLTEKGRELLRTYRAWRESLRLFGIGADE